MASQREDGSGRRRPLDVRGWIVVGLGCAAVVGIGVLGPGDRAPSGSASEAAPATIATASTTAAVEAEQASPSSTTTDASTTTSTSTSTSTTVDPGAAALEARLDGGRQALPDTIGAGSRASVVLDGGDAVLMYVLATDDPSAYARAAAATLWADAPLLFADPAVDTVGIGIEYATGKPSREGDAVAAGIRIDRAAYEAQDWVALGPAVAADPKVLLCLGSQRFVSAELPDAIELTSC